jgi:sodium/hydrogen antiporter
VSAWAAAAAAASVSGVALASRRLAPTVVSGPMLLVGAGLACGPVGLDLLDLSRDAEAVQLLLEVTLVAVLFTDAAGVRWAALRRDDGLPLRLLGHAVASAAESDLREGPAEQVRDTRADAAVGTGSTRRG